MDFKSIFDRRRKNPLTGDVIQFRPKKIPGRVEFDAQYNIELPHHHDALNLDNMSDADLKIVVDHPALCPDVRLYAKRSLLARTYRSAGFILSAKELEDEMEKIYRQLDDELRW